jgi:hypothetical protein
MNMNLPLPTLEIGEASPSLQGEGFVASPTAQEDHKAKRHAIRRIFDDNMKNRPVKHDAAHVLLLSWDEKLDDMGVQPEVAKYLLRKTKIIALTGVYRSMI